MDRTATGALLWSRAVLLASVAFFAGVVGHVSADGLLPAPAVLAGLLLLGVPLCAGQLRRPASATRIVLLLVSGQTAVHIALSVTAGHRGDHAAGATGGAAHPGPVVLPTSDGRRVGSLLDGYQGSIGHVADAQPALPVGSVFAELSVHAPMMAAHLAAAVAVGIWLAVGERTLWTLLALAAGVLLRPLVLALARLRLAVTGRLPAPVVTVPVALPTLARLARSLQRRGPPALLA